MFVKKLSIPIAPLSGYYKDRRATDFPYDIFVLNGLKKIKNFSRNFTIFIFITIIICIIFTMIHIYSFSHVNELTNADAAIILGASVWNNKPSPVFQERINHGIWLYKNGFVKNLIFTGGIGKKSLFSESFIAMEFAIEKLIPAENIFIEELSTITRENIFYAKTIIIDNNFDKIIIVSDPLHMKRSLTIAKDYGINVYSSPTPTTKYISLKTKARFLLYETFFYIVYIIYKNSFTIMLSLISFIFLFSIYSQWGLLPHPCGAVAVCNTYHSMVVNPHR